ncbi:MAG: peptide deformylase [Candidatus Marinimicrobia bacterium]|nr:peptide deformylase [Candidatus Neomarinimicrobiota bacterium]
MKDRIITNFKLLKKVSRPTTWKEIEKLNLIERLKTANETAWTKGVGLAAIQIGIPIRAAWFMDGDKKDIILVNPTITKATSPIIVPKEGCLSIPDVWSQTRRYNEITVTTLTEKGPATLEFLEFNAIVVQHEVDHMNGILNLGRRYIPPLRVGRNEPCPCKSGKKYKKCCLGKLEQPQVELEKKEEVK